MLIEKLLLFGIVGGVAFFTVGTILYFVSRCGCGLKPDPEDY